MWKKLKKDRNMTQNRRKDKNRHLWMNAITYQNELKNFFEFRRSLINKHKQWWKGKERDYFDAICFFGLIKDGDNDENYSTLTKSEMKCFDRISVIRLQSEADQILKMRKTFMDDIV